jgi:hypothetical protein
LQEEGREDYYSLIENWEFVEFCDRRVTVQAQSSVIIYVCVCGRFLLQTSLLVSKVGDLSVFHKIFSTINSGVAVA